MSDSLAGDCLLELAVHGDDALDRGLDAGGRVHHGGARADGAGSDRPGIAAERVVGARDKLHRHAEGPLGGVGGGFGAFKRGQQRGAGIPRHVCARAGDIVAVAGTDRDGGNGEGAELAEQRVEVGDDLVEHGLVEVDEVHLVDREDDLANAKQRGDGGVPAGLHEQALACVDQEHRQVGLGSAGDHVAGVLFVAWRVGEDETAAWGFEEAVGYIDGDALVAFGGEAIDQQGIVGAAGDGAEADAVALQRRHHVVGDGAALEQQAADEGGLAVVHRAAGEYAQ